MISLAHVRAQDGRVVEVELAEVDAGEDAGRRFVLQVAVAATCAVIDVEAAVAIDVDPRDPEIFAQRLGAAGERLGDAPLRWSSWRNASSSQSTTMG